jgi:O-antigen/teichoic acid export membrane protein
MTHARRRAVNAAALLASGFVSKIVFFLATVRIVKELDVPDNGVFQLAYTLATAFMAITEFGLRGYVIRELARVRDHPVRARELFLRVIAARTATGAVCGLVAIPAMAVLGYQAQTLAVTGWFLVFAFMDSLAILAKGAIRAYERMEFDAVFSVIGRAAILLLVLWLVRTGRLTLGTIAASHMAGALLEVGLLALALRRWSPLRFIGPADWQSVKAVLMASLPLGVLAVIGMLYLRTGTFVLSLMRGDDAVAYFQTAARLPEALSFLPLAMVNALIPHLSRHHGQRDLLGRHGTFLLRYLGFAGAFFAVVMAMETPWIIRFLWKPEYLAAAPTFRLYGLFFLFSSAQYVTANLLICMNEERRVMHVYLGSLVLNVVLNIALIAALGVTGAALALVASECFSAVALGALVARRGVPIAPSVTVQVGAVAALTGTVLFASAGLPPPARITVAAVAVAAAVATLAWRHDRLLLLKLLGRDASFQPRA